MKIECVLSVKRRTYARVQKDDPKKQTIEIPYRVDRHKVGSL